MKIAIQGIDYSAALDASHPLTIERKLNEPSVCQLWLSLPSGGSVAAPLRNQSLRVEGDDGTLYFTGYVACSPMPEYAGMSMSGPRYRMAIHAVSDELLLDQLPASSNEASAGITAGEWMAALVTHTRSAALGTGGLTLDAPIGAIAAEPGAVWSKSAGQAAFQARAAYRALNGQLELAQIPAAVHVLNEGDGSLDPAALTMTPGVSRALANDITVCGEREAVAYVTEYLVGDGTSTQFILSAEPFLPTSSKATIVDELFNKADIDYSVWDNSGGAGYFSLGGGGLTMNGGNGIDGQAMLTWIDPVELGGTLLVEAKGVMLATGSAGILAGLFVGLDTLAGCVAGYQVTAQAGTGAVTLQPVVMGVANGITYAVNPENQYTLRVWVYCAEYERSLAVYRSYGDAGSVTNGGQHNQAPARMLFEIQEFVNGVAGMPVMLYDGSVASLPATCCVAAASLINLAGSMRAFRATNLGPVWVQSARTGESFCSRRVGSAVQAGECYLDRSGSLVFYTGFVPVAGEQIAVSYRAVGRAVGRAVNSASQQELAAAGLPAVAAWIGSVTAPAPRSSADCRNAAATMVAASASSSALWSGTFKGTRLNFASDVWPGDALQIQAPSMNVNCQLIVRAVKLSYRSSYPELVTYFVSYANDWADDLAIRTSKSVPADAWLPVAVSPVVLANLTNLTVTSVNGSTVTINTGVAAPPRGGFEIRRRDFAFMPGEDADLVMRGSQPNMTFSRETFDERFYIRMYDGSTPPNYSEFSAALFLNLPLGS